MDYYTLRVAGLKRNLPLVKLTPKIKVASFNLLGDVELVDAIAKIIAPKIQGLKFDYLVGPEVKVVPLLHALSAMLKKKKCVICRKQIHGYMVSPVKVGCGGSLVINGDDAKCLQGKRVVVIDDVVTSGKTFSVLAELMAKTKAQIVGKFAIFKQGDHPKIPADITFLYKLPVFPN